LRYRLGVAIYRRLAELIVAWGAPPLAGVATGSGGLDATADNRTAVQLRRSSWRVVGGVISTTSLILVLLVLVD